MSIHAFAVPRRTKTPREVCTEGCSPGTLSSVSVAVEFLASPLELLSAASGATVALGLALTTAAASLGKFARVISSDRKAVAKAEARVRLQADMLANLREELLRAEWETRALHSRVDPRGSDSIDLEDWLLDRRQLIQEALPNADENVPDVGQAR